jgi:hypothetical protein
MGHVARMGEKRDTCGKLIHRAPQNHLVESRFYCKTELQACSSFTYVMYAVQCSKKKSYQSIFNPLKMSKSVRQGNVQN